MSFYKVFNHFSRIPLEKQFLRLRNVVICNRKLLSTESRDQVNVDDFQPNIRDDNLYDEHIITSAFQKVLLAVGSGAMSLFDPTRDDMIAVFGETTGAAAARSIRVKMLLNEEGREILRDKPRLNSTTVDFNYLATLPADTLGGVYSKFFQDNGVSPDTRQPVHFVEDKESAYVIQRYREVHDLVHAILFMPTDMLGEVTIKWVEAIQTGLPMCTLGGVFGAYRLSKKQRQLYISSYLPWALKCGHEGEFLMNIYFEKHWEEPINQIRARLKIPDLIIV